MTIWEKIKQMLKSRTVVTLAILILFTLLEEVAKVVPAEWQSVITTLMAALGITFRVTPQAKFNKSSDPN